MIVYYYILKGPGGHEKLSKTVTLENLEKLGPHDITYISVPNIAENVELDVLVEDKGIPTNLWQ